MGETIWRHCCRCQRPMILDGSKSFVQNGERYWLCPACWRHYHKAGDRASVAWTKLRGDRWDH